MDDARARQDMLGTRANKPKPERLTFPVQNKIKKERNNLVSVCFILVDSQISLKFGEIPQCSLFLW